MFSIFHALAPRTKGILYVLFSVMVWGGWIVITRYSVRGSLNAFDITALRFGVAGALLLPVLLRKGLAIGPYGWKGAMALAFLMGASFNVIAIFGMRFAPASHAAALINTGMMVTTTLFGILLLKEKTTKLRLGGVALSVIGIGCLLTARPFAAGGEDLHGHFLFLLAGMMWAGYALLVRRWKVEALHATAAVCGFSFMIYMPIYLLFLHSNIGIENIKEVVFQGFYQGIINSILALLCFNRGIALLGATTSGAFLPLVPVVATLIAIPLLGELPNGMECVGILLASGGVFLSTGIAGRVLMRSSSPTQRELK